MSKQRGSSAARPCCAVREMVLAEVAAEDDGERPDFSAWAPSRDAIKPLVTGDLTVGRRSV
jgi:hypothetical protein